MPERPHLTGPIDTAGLLGWFRARSVPGMEAVDDRSYARMVRIDGGVAGIEFTDDRVATGEGPTLTVFATTEAGRSQAEAIARRLFDLDADTTSVDAALAADPVLASLVAATPGVRVPGAAGLTEILVRAIVGQQVTVAAARGQLARLVAELGEPVPPAVTPPALQPDSAAPDRRVARVFPAAATIAEHAGEVLRGPRARTDTVIRCCAAIADGSLTAADGPSVVDLIDRLTALRGIGPWTADYVAMRMLGAPDVLVRKDVALLRGARALGLADSFGELTAAAARFAPWRSYLSMHLWAAAG